MECGDAPAGTGERRCVHRMGMNDRADVVPGLEDVAMKPPLARREATAEPAAIQIHQRNAVGFECVIAHSGGAHEKFPLLAAQTDSARAPMGQAGPAAPASAAKHPLLPFPF